jgi:cytoskeletal protein RodZ
MAPVDAGVMASGIASGMAFAGGDAGAAAAGDELLDRAETLGAAFRQRREALGVSLEHLSMTTRIKPQYLSALEEMRFEDLPSRAFVVGYVRACAATLGFNPEAAVERYKLEAPASGPALATPVSVDRDRDRDPRVRAFVMLGGLVVAAIVVWNVAERLRVHAPARRGPAPIVLPAAASSTKGPSGPVTLGAPLPPPAEATNPEPYVTPGLDVGSSAPPVAVAPAMPAAGTPFDAKGQTVYGAAPAAAHIILVAVKPVSLVVRGSDGKVYFARQLETGQAYAAPAVDGLQAEVSNPAVVGVYVDRVLRGPLTAATASLSSLGAVAPAPAHP